MVSIVLIVVWPFVIKIEESPRHDDTHCHAEDCDEDSKDDCFDGFVGVNIFLRLLLLEHEEAWHQDVGAGDREVQEGRRKQHDGDARVCYEAVRDRRFHEVLAILVQKTLSQDN